MGARALDLARDEIVQLGVLWQLRLLWLAAAEHHPVNLRPREQFVEAPRRREEDDVSGLAGRDDAAAGTERLCGSGAHEWRPRADGGDGEVCVKIVRNNKDFFDQSLSEVKILQMLNANDPDDARCILRLRAFFYHRERPIRSKRLAPPGARTVGPRPRLAPRERARRPLRSEARHGLVRSAHPLAPLQGRGVQL